MPKFVDCEITYQVELETKNLQEESKKVREELKELNNSDSKASKGLEQRETPVKNTSNYLNKFNSHVIY
ncbi:hypothetical protein [Gilliamella apicola]|uniref:hypothetical protein n=1 Tax=Gilliamella apicola TaxID=1196095 RepID=UPI0009FD5A68|nr:hypothetical protein [Gilliamella apicola]ORF45453.1 hypothetical protein B5800_07645 [Gilliamella apicola]ORF47401.1 hypothetical protein B5799_12725 [Gilliamella apicola]ORF49607.1 hypothetical protein B5803_10280 [Gilliamella apicola]ORF52902.1 hypothetical protein B5802_09465 [Gilliamella apicola]ORF53964.1 hypothetical protein B5798_07875 [Gilliamella apicola]